jgi:hypothetical protein
MLIEMLTQQTKIKTFVDDLKETNISIWVEFYIVINIFVYWIDYYRYIYECQSFISYQSNKLLSLYKQSSELLFKI